MGGLCRNCEEAFGEYVTSEERESGELVHLFECPECDYQWVYPSAWRSEG